VPREVEGGQEQGLAILTEDFAMQNVLLQIGIPLIAPTGRRITELKKYVVQCYACFKFINDQDQSINRVCPRCGYLTLSRISCTVSSAGDVLLHRKKGWKPAKGIQARKEKALVEQKKRRRKGLRETLHFG
jgi:RNA-binding protein NOB1